MTWFVVVGNERWLDLARRGAFVAKVEAARVAAELPPRARRRASARPGYASAVFDGNAVRAVALRRHATARRESC